MAAIKGGGASKANRERRATIRKLEAGRDAAAARVERAKLDLAQAKVALKAARGSARRRPAV